jgi:hypothetical protein
MNRREFARNVVEAIVGVAVVPQCFEKPKLPFVLTSSKLREIRDEMVAAQGMSCVDFYYIGPASSRCCQQPYRLPEPPPDISIADKLRIRDMLG